MKRTHGQVNEDTGKVEVRNVKRARAARFGTPVQNSTRGQRIRRALIG